MYYRLKKREEDVKAILKLKNIKPCSEVCKNESITTTAEPTTVGTTLLMEPATGDLETEQQLPTNDTDVTEETDSTV
ncbi:unnamed protein product [Enterobius vermicularis]|uniref:Uncharacterized protein n=1 Tax=Enterobius vermicularis TaxID=51028 RepID=A0A0N4V6R1_ENTVE|nr:unnamed protein product [Enterobius vermicularis]